ncbi:MAG: hypothetical protein U9O94_11075 [Nanoarchaeota archaeon]|nr:hypothetical protein [Nanoarchaeota archaeon]
MKKAKAGLVLMIDAEGEFGRIPFSPRDKLKHKLFMFASSLLGLDYSIKTLKNMVGILKKYNVPATFFFVGALLLKNKDKKILNEYLERDIKTKYLWGKGKLKKVIPFWGSYVQKEFKNSILEVSIHNFLHESNFSEPDENIDKSIKFSKVAAKNLGFRVNTYAAPWFELEDPKNPSRAYNILKKNGINVTRFDGVRKKYEKLVFKDRKNGFYNRFGVNCVYSSHFIGNGKVDLEEQREIEEGIKKAIKNKSIYALSTHETTFLRHGLKHFEDIIKIIKKYEKDLNIATLYDMSKAFRR